MVTEQASGDSASSDNECPECETVFRLPGLEVGETFACPECLLPLKVIGIQADGKLQLEMTEMDVRDWGE